MVPGVMPNRRGFLICDLTEIGAMMAIDGLRSDCWMSAATLRSNNVESKSAVGLFVGHGRARDLI